MWSASRFAGSTYFRAGRTVLSLVVLYVAVGLAMGLYELARDAGHTTPMAVITQDVLASWWGITVTGYVLLLWPLAYLNIHVLGQAGEN